MVCYIGLYPLTTEHVESRGTSRYCLLQVCCESIFKECGLVASFFQDVLSNLKYQRF